MIWPIGPIFCICRIESSMSSRVKARLAELLLQLRGLLLVEGLLGPLDEA